MSAYEDEYAKWVASLSPKQRAKLKAQGLDKPLDDHRQTNTPGNAEAVFATIGSDFDYDQFDEQPKLDTSQLEAKALEYGSQLLAWVFARLQSNQSQKTASIERDALLFALGMASLDGKTETELANEYSITRAAFSARVKNWQRLLGLNPSSFMKSEKACRAYRNARLNNLTRK